MIELRGLIPARFLPPAEPTKYEQQVIVNWLELEVPRKTPVPMVDNLKGWRNREVFWFVRSYDWTAVMYR